MPVLTFSVPETPRGKDGAGRLGLRGRDAPFDNHTGESFGRESFAMARTVETDLTRLLGIQNPIMIAGMGGTTMAELAAAGGNAGGIGTLGAIPLINDPEGMRKEIQKTKALMPEGTPFGVDLLLPSAEEGARKTNKAVGNDTMDALVDVFIEEE